MKKKSLLIFILILTLILTMFMAGCGSDSSSDQAEPEGTTEVTEDTQDTGEAADEGSDDATDEAAPQDLEEYVQSDEAVLNSLGSQEDGQTTVSVEGNELIYTYDFSKYEGVTKEQMADEDMLSSLGDTLDEGKSTFVDIAKSLEEGSGISGIRIIVRYTWEDEVLLEKAYTSEDE